MLRVKNMHFDASLDPLGQWGKEKLSYVHYVVKGGKAKLHKLKLFTWVFHRLSSVAAIPQQLCSLAQLGCTREAGTSKYIIYNYEFSLTYVQAWS